MKKDKEKKQERSKIGEDKRKTLCKTMSEYNLGNKRNKIFVTNAGYNYLNE